LIINTKKLFIFFIITTISLAIIGCNNNKEISSNDRFEKKISLYKKIMKKSKKILKKIPWELVLGI